MGFVVKAQQDKTEYFFEVCDNRVAECAGEVGEPEHRRYYWSTGKVDGEDDPSPMTVENMLAEMALLEDAMRPDEAILLAAFIDREVGTKPVPTGPIGAHPLPDEGVLT